VSANFANINALFLAPSGTTVSLFDRFINRSKSLLFDKSAFANLSSGSDALYYIGTDNSLKEIDLTVGGNEHSKSIIDTPKFVLLQTTGIIDKTGKACGLVAISKSNSKTYCIGDILTFFTDFYKAVQTDSSGNILYYQDNFANLIKLDMTNPSDPIRTVLDSQIVGFAVNPLGDVLVGVTAGTDYYGNPGKTLRIHLGGNQSHQDLLVASILATIEALPGTNNFYFGGASVNDYSCSGSACNKVVKSGSSYSLQYDSSIVLPTCLAEAGCSAVYTGNTIAMAAAPAKGVNSNTPGLNWFFTTSGTVLMDKNASCPGGQSCISWTGTLTGQVGSSFNLVDHINRIAGANSVVLILAADKVGTGLYRFNITTSIMETLMAPGDYAISAFDVDSDGNTTVSATRNSDKANVIATVAAGSTTIGITSSALSSPADQIATVAP
jgi:hypothetical protein